MKRFMFAALVLVLLASCEVVVVEPRYDYRDNVTGYYEIEEYSETYSDYTYYSMHVTKGGGYGGTIYLDNFYGADIRVEAYVDRDRITIPYQIVDDYEIKGNGNVRGDAMSLNYSVRDLYEGTITDYCDTWATR